MSKKRETIVERIFKLIGEELNIVDYLDLAKMSDKELKSKYKDVVNGSYSYYESINYGEISNTDLARFTDEELEMIGVK